MLRTLVISLLITFSMSYAQQQDDAENARIYYQRGMQAYQEKNYEACLENLLKAEKLSSLSPEIKYNIACAYALTGKKQEAVDYLRKTVKMGFGFDAGKDADFTSLHGTPEFEEVLKEIKEYSRPIGNSRIAFTIKEKDLIPEGIAYDPADKSFYLGSIYKSKILKIDSLGNVKNFKDEGEDGLWSVIGIRVDPKKRILWAASSAGNSMKKPDSINSGSTGIFKFDLESGKLIKKYIIRKSPENHFLNDIAVSPDGDIFITDSFFSAVYSIPKSSDSLQLFTMLKDYQYPNGIALNSDGSRIFVAHSSGIVSIDRNTRNISPLKNMNNIVTSYSDGLYFFNNSLIGIQNLNFNRISRFYLNNDLDTVERHEILEANNPEFNIPTTGAVAGSRFYYIANSQIRSFDSKGRIFPEERLKDVVILEAGLK